MALAVKTKRQLRVVIALAVVAVLAVAVVRNWDRIVPAIGAGTEKAYDATRGIGDSK